MVIFSDTEEFMQYEPSLLTFTSICCAVQTLTQAPCYNFGREVIAKMFQTTTIDEVCGQMISSHSFNSFASTIAKILIK